MPKKIVVIYTLSVIIFSVVVFFVVSYRKNKLFNQENLSQIVFSTSNFRTKYKSPCDAIINGDPDVADSWVKINFHCPSGLKNSTLATIVFKEKPTWRQIMTEFSRVLGFESSNVINNPNWRCFVNQHTELTDKNINNWDKEALKKESIDCIDSSRDLNYLKNYYGKK